MINNKLILSATVLLLFIGASAMAETPDVGLFEQPCEKLEPPPPQLAEFMTGYLQAVAKNETPPQPTAEGMALYTQWQQQRMLQDFGGLCRYRAANASLSPHAGPRIIMFGDSITEGWNKLAVTQDMQVVNRGISGQSTAQMLLRFRADVINLQADIVHILAGTNDIAGNTGPTTVEFIQNNIRTMAELARVHGIKVILASIPPASAFDWRPEIQPAEDIRRMNIWIEDYAREQGFAFIDYHSALTNAEGGMGSTFSDDGVHPNAAGYSVMHRLLSSALER